MDDVEKAVAKESIKFGVGVAAGAYSKHASSNGPLVGQVGSAIGATLATGGTIGAALSAGAGTITASAVAATAATSAAVIAAVPFVAAAAAIGGGIWGIIPLRQLGLAVV